MPNVESQINKSRRFTRCFFPSRHRGIRQSEARLFEEIAPCYDLTHFSKVKSKLETPTIRFRLSYVRSRAGKTHTHTYIYIYIRIYIYIYIREWESTLLGIFSRDTTILEKKQRAERKRNIRFFIIKWKREKDREKDLFSVYWNLIKKFPEKFRIFYVFLFTIPEKRLENFFTLK